MVLLAVLTLVAVIWLARRWQTSGFEWGLFFSTLRDMDPAWLGAALCFILLTYLGRALRWEVMLRPMRPDASLWNVLSATLIGFTAIVLFGRAGELVRPYLIANKEHVSFSSQIAAWVLERIFDLLMVLLLFGLALGQIAHSDVLPGTRVQQFLAAGGYVVGITCVACLVALFAFRRFDGRVPQRLVAALGFLPPQHLAKVKRVMHSFSQGMQSTRHQSFAFLLVLYTLAEWILIAGGFVCLFHAFPATARMNLTDAVIFLGFVSFGSALQIPGIGGGMQLTAVLVLTELFGLNLEVSSGIAIVLWVMTFVVVVPFGLVLAFHEGIRWRSLRHLREDPAV